jgi:signal transduction histidine kinase
MLGIGGWLAACCAAALAGLAWRTLGARMEAVTRACHELRGPLTAARLGLQLGARSGELSADRLRALDLELGRAGLALEDLDAVGVRHGLTPRVAPVDMTELLSSSVEAWRPAAAAQARELRATWLGPTVGVLGDRLRLAQATGNLIANAIEHGSGTIEVRGSAGGVAVTVEVSDDGPGLPAPLPELMRRARRGRGQRGRGLAIASAVAEAHGGRLRAAPAGECRARLVLELPCGGEGENRGPRRTAPDL